MKHFIEPELRAAFIDRAIRFDWILARIIAVFAVGIELFNLIRVTFYSPSGLTTPNNWTYFGFYLTFLTGAAAFLVIDRLKGSGLRRQTRYRILLAAGSFFVLWQVLFAVFDLSSSLSIGKISGAVALVSFAALFVMKPLYAMVNLLGGYFILLTYIATLNDFGTLLNYVLIGIMSLVIYFARLYGILNELKQADELRSMDRALEESEARFRLSNEQYETLLDQSHLITFQWNLRRDVVHFSSAWEEIFALPREIYHVEEAIRTGVYLTRAQKDALLRCVRATRAGEDFQKEELLLPVKGGGQRWFEVHMMCQKDRHGRPAVGIGLLVDIMDQKNRILELEKETSMDAFTRTLNKAAFESYGARRLAGLAPGEELALLILDMDDFKGVNDTYGHQAGDHVLVCLSGQMKALAPSRCQIGRMGGDEFAVLFDPPGAGQAAGDYAARLIDAVRAIEWEGRPLSVGCSIGIALGGAGASYEDLYAAADRALYEAKRQGKDCWQMAAAAP